MKIKINNLSPIVPSEPGEYFIWRDVKQTGGFEDEDFKYPKLIEVEKLSPNFIGFTVFFDGGYTSEHYRHKIGAKKTGWFFSEKIEFDLEVPK